MSSANISIFITIFLLYLFCIISKYSIYSSPFVRLKSKELLKQSFKWCNASEKNTISSLRDSIYSSAYLNSARLLTTDSELSEMTGIDIQALWKKIEDKESTLTKKLSKEMKLRKNAISNGASWK